LVVTDTLENPTILFDVEKIDKFAEDFKPETVGKIEETRVAQINVKQRWSRSCIAFDTDQSVQTRYSIHVNV
jgi:hypothetical protein